MDETPTGARTTPDDGKPQPVEDTTEPARTTAPEEAEVPAPSDAATETVTPTGTSGVAGSTATATPSEATVGTEATATPGTAGATGSGEAGGASPKRHNADRSGGQQPHGQMTGAVNQFIETAYNVTGSAGMPAPQQRDGFVSEADLRSYLRHYTSPVPYDEALQALQADCVVTLCGRPGIGKRAGGLHLLRDVTEGQIIVLSPAKTLKELSAYKFQRDHGYLVVDRQSEGRTAETDFTWLTVRDQVREGGAYLVITSTAATLRKAEVRHVEWTTPDIRRVLHKYTHHRDMDEEDLERVLKQFAVDFTITDFANVARRIGSGDDVDIAMAHHDAAAAADVHAWFGEAHSRRDTLEITALAFAEGASWQTFERLLTHLEECVNATIPTPEPSGDDGKRPDDPLPSLRNSITKNQLVIVEASEKGSGQIIRFRHTGYRRLVLEKLWNSYDARFWDAVHTWICEIVGDVSSILGNFSALPAQGLAKLAATNFDEVRSQFLEPWAAGSQGWPGQLTATYVLWSMCYDEVTAPLALASAMRWANHGQPAQRWTAVVAFSGLLGVWYPGDALRQLWQLIINSSEQADPCVALACLFATLTDNSPESAAKVISMLNHHAAQLAVRPSPGKRQQNLVRLRELTMLALLAVVSVRDGTDRRPAVFVYLHRRPEGAAGVAKIWATLLRFPPHRKATLTVLWEGLSLLRQISKDPTADARTLGAAMGAVLSKSECAQLDHDLTKIDYYKRKGQADTESMAVVLLEALNEIYSHERMSDDESVPHPDKA